LDLLKGTKSKDAFTVSAELLQSKLVQTFPRKDHWFGQFLLDTDCENELSSRRTGETIDCLKLFAGRADSGSEDSAILLQGPLVGRCHPTRLGPRIR
jgi:hypothetical protein